MSWTRGGRLVGLDEVETGRSVAAGAEGWFTGRLEIVRTTLSLSCAEASNAKPPAKNTIAANRYQIFFKSFKT